MSSAARCSAALLLLPALLAAAPAGEAPAGAPAPGPRLHAERIDSAAEMDELALVLDGAAHVKLLVERASSRIWYINTSLFSFHHDFVREVLLADRPEACPAQPSFDEANRRGDGRRYILATLVRHPRGAGAYTWELLERDEPTPGVLRQAQLALARTFFAPVAHRPLSPTQRRIAGRTDGLAVAPDDLLDPPGNVQLLNPGTATGRLRVIPDEAELARRPPGASEIVVLRELPLDITPVAGILCATHSTPLSHVSLRARGWGIPNVCFTQLPAALEGLEGKWVRLHASPQGVELREATPAEIEAAERARAKPAAAAPLPPADLGRRDLPGLGELTRGDAAAVGAKAAGVGWLFRHQDTSFAVPPGFAVPFAHAVDFFAHNRLDGALRRLAADASLASDPGRCRRLAALQEQIRRGEHVPAFRKELLARVQGLGLRRGLFVRSSTNAEDLPGMSGAGLYETVPNVQGEQALLAAVKQVWASVWSCRAWEERSFRGIPHAAVFPGVLVQEAAPVEQAGVLITGDVTGRGTSPGEPAITVNAKHGLGLRVVDGRSVPEQLLYLRRAERMLVLSRSVDALAAMPAPGGGVVERPVEPGQPVLTLAAVRALDRAAASAQALFPDVPLLDIEWAIGPDGRVYLLQARPYVVAGE